MVCDEKGEISYRKPERMEQETEGGPMKRLAQSASILVLTLVLAGCFQITQEIDLSDGGPGAYVTTILEVDKTFAGAEMDLFLESLEMSVPGLTEQAVHRRYETTQDYSTRVVYSWEGRTKAAGDFQLTARDDGSYEFRYPIRKVDNLSDQTDSSTVILVVRARLPKAVDFANTLNVHDNVAVWELTKADLLRGVELRALTVAE